MEKKKHESNTNVETIRLRVAAGKLIDNGFDNITVGLVDGKPSATFSVGSDHHTVELSDITRPQAKKEVKRSNYQDHTNEMILNCKRNLAEINMKLEDLRMKIYLKPHQSEDEAERLLTAKRAIESTLKLIS